MAENPSISLMSMGLPSASSDRAFSNAYPSLKRGLPDSYDGSSFAETMLSMASDKRLRYGNNAGEAIFGDSMPDQLLSGISMVDAGYTAPTNMSKGIVANANVCRKYDKRWDDAFTPYMPLWSAAAESNISAEPGTTTMATPPIINYLLELARIHRQTQRLVQRGNILNDLTQIVDQYETLLPLTATESKSTWNLVGNIVSIMDDRPYTDSTLGRMQQGTGERLVNTSASYYSKVFNMFSPEVRVGDQLFWKWTEVDLSWTRALIDPTGAAVVPRTAQAFRSLQLVGFSSSDTDAIAQDTSAQSPMDLSDPRDEDLAYIRKDAELAQYFQEYDVADDGEIRLRQNNDADLQGRIDAVSQIVYDAWEPGRCEYAGFVRDITGMNPSRDQIRAAHRSQEAMKSLQVLGINVCK